MPPGPRDHDSNRPGLLAAASCLGIAMASVTSLSGLTAGGWAIRMDSGLGRGAGELLLSFESHWGVADAIFVGPPAGERGAFAPDSRQADRGAIEDQPRDCLGFLFLALQALPMTVLRYLLAFQGSCLPREFLHGKFVTVPLLCLTVRETLIRT